MSKIREDRLHNDYTSVKIKILDAKGNPPENYRLEITNCRGIKKISNGKPNYSDRHIISISNFPQDYSDPGQLPTVKAETPLFHPNVYSDGRFCFAGKDISRVSHPLDALIKRIISMIQYENLRFGNPANSRAKKWADSHGSLFPLALNSANTISSSPPQLTWR